MCACYVTRSTDQRKNIPQTAAHPSSHKKCMRLGKEKKKATNDDTRNIETEWQLDVKMQKLKHLNHRSDRSRCESVWARFYAN